MLQLIRSRVTSIFIKILFVLLIASFAIWGIGDIFLGNPGGRAAIKIGDAEWNSVQVFQQFDRVRRRLPASITAQQAAELGVLDNVLEQMINEGLFAAEGQSLSLGAGETVIRQRIADTPAFRDSTGRFSSDAFRQTLFNAGLSEEEFVSTLTTEIARDQLIGATISGLATSKPMTQALFNYRNERRTADIVVIRSADITNIKQPNDGELDAYYKENASDYEAPEYRRITYVALAPEDLAAEILIGDDAIAAEYDARANQFTTPSTRDVDQIIFLEEAEAKTAAERIAGGEGFAKVALDITGADAEAIKLGNVQRADLLEQTQEVVFSTSAGGITAPIASDLGWHIFRVHTATEDSVTPLEQVRDQIKQELAHDLALDAIFELANTLEDELAAGSTVEEAATAVNVKTKRLAALDPAGRDAAGKQVEGLASNPEFLSLAAETGKGQQSKLGETRDGTYFILRVDNVTAPATRPFNTVRDQVTQHWQTEERASAALRQAEAIQSAVNGGANLHAAARQIGQDVRRVGPFTRNGSGLADGLARDVASAAFDAKLGGLDLIEADGQVVVISPVEQTAADPAKLDKALARVGNEIRTAMQSDIVDGLMRGLRQRHEVTIDRSYIDSLLRDGQ